MTETMNYSASNRPISAIQTYQQDAGTTSSNIGLNPTSKWRSWWISKPLLWTYSAYTMCLALATVYLTAAGLAVDGLAGCGAVRPWE
jgi:hypothetical protein